MASIDSQDFHIAQQGRSIQPRIEEHCMTTVFDQRCEAPLDSQAGIFGRVIVQDRQAHAGAGDIRRVGCLCGFSFRGWW